MNATPLPALEIEALALSTLTVAPDDDLERPCQPENRERRSLKTKRMLPIGLVAIASLTGAALALSPVARELASRNAMKADANMPLPPRVDNIGVRVSMPRWGMEAMGAPAGISPTMIEPGSPRRPAANAWLLRPPILQEEASKPR
jgi:hypothetical protein